MALPTLASLIPDATSMAYYVELMTNANIAGMAPAMFLSHMAANFSPIVNTLVVLYIMAWGYFMLAGVRPSSGFNPGSGLLKIVIVTALAVNTGLYLMYIINAVWNLPSIIASMFLPDSTFITTITGLLAWGGATGFTSNGVNIEIYDMLITWILSVVVGIGQSITTDGIQGGNAQADMLSVGLYITSGSLAAIIIGIKVVAKVTLGILLSFSPIMIMCLLFEKSKPYLDAYINAVVTIVLTLILLSLTSIFLLPLVAKTVLLYYLYAQAAGGSLDANESVQLAAILTIYGYVIKQVPQTAASIARGYSISTPDSAGAKKNPGEVARQQGG